MSLTNHKVFVQISFENLPCLSSGVTGPHPPASPPACTAHKEAWLQAAVDWFRPKGSNLLLTLL